MTEKKSNFLRYEVITVTPLEQNASIVFDSSTNLGVIIDPGGNLFRIIEAVTRHDIKIEGIWLTHGHIDHAGGAAELREILTRREGSNIPIVGPHMADAYLLNTLSEVGAIYGVHGARNVVSDRWLEDGDELRVGTIPFSVMHCPGHSPGSVMFYQADGKLAVTGDVLFNGSIGRTDLPLSDHKVFMDSIACKILPLPDEVVFLPGHGEPSTIGYEKTYNPFLRSIIRKFNPH